MKRELAAEASHEARALRTAHLIRAAVLVVIGVAIAFTAPLHSQFEFNIWVLGVGFVLIGAATLLEYSAARGTNESWWIAARAVVAFAAAGSLIAVTDTTTLALIVAIWALLTALITTMRLVRKTQPPRVALPSLLLSVALAAATLMTSSDPIAVIGFFGAYAIVRGVFLAIAALDTREASAPVSVVTQETN
ncbi:hypothetical protein QBL02_08065 [Leucobacter sp. UT-8R-CII-1-4]|uniref:hypothetical protein n=1 Tax=Leucobacter sp. UT-8R-CII-1-4 TaxID=3040075 RepID=UPI0024A857ED|nr:hypothetical protein [Leucobacter sp. UT-8R-CII-1-4]MDI6023497.1 hypothetical protein [Leucobacter sp. UT-8R-CII-1-4]